ncbi:hypothetical protein AXF42_Ash016007 [Apostasia shenzhenica]|uniref:Uncharacterized protein n=1 Tax=Apostasia shenzhenica TaxID=1088818 RepID=A0A2I0AWP6_9ASPA|nr:hypothetical protein AXF42_Ash016007 [Apostasia shenzhenica]
MASSNIARRRDLLLRRDGAVNAVLLLLILIILHWPAMATAVLQLPPNFANLNDDPETVEGVVKVGLAAYEHHRINGGWRQGYPPLYLVQVLKAGMMFNMNNHAIALKFCAIFKAKLRWDSRVLVNVIITFTMLRLDPLDPFVLLNVDKRTIYVRYIEYL